MQTLREKTPSTTVQNVVDLTYPRPADKNQAGQVTVRVAAEDAITSSGVARILTGDRRLVPAAFDEPADVLVFIAGQVAAQDIQRLRSMRESARSVVLLANGVGEEALLTLVECGVVGILARRSSGVAELAEAVVSAANNQGVMPKEVLGKLLALVRNMQKDTLGSLGFNSSGLTQREVDILRMLAEGAETAEIARRLTYSESTIKHVLHALTTRFRFRNRAHAVACAVRAGIL
ncbi:response regulator transcription factor [Amycolatopsis sp. NPDC004368]